MGKRSAKKLLKDYRTGEIDLKDAERIEQWYLRAAATEEQPAEIPDLERLQGQGLQRVLERESGRQKPSASRRWISRVWVRYAAVLLVALGVGIWVFDAPWKSFEEAEPIIILPGGNRATLTLSTGAVVDLNIAHEEIVVGEDILYADGSAVVGTGPNGEHPHAANPAASELALSTPAGGTYRITLSDGTKVWLNAHSTLKYPNRFSGNERVVSLVGEAYFEVATDRSKPFKIMTKAQAIEVLGTKFNVSAYADEKVEKTTLSEGRVRIAAEHAGRIGWTVLAPGQQGMVSNDRVVVSEADVFSATAWTNGRFSFDGKLFVDIMQELARWYDFEVVYEGSIPDMQLIGGAFRTDKIATVLQFLESGNLKYRIEKNDIGKNRVVITNKGKEGDR